MHEWTKMTAIFQWSLILSKYVKVILVKFCFVQQQQAVLNEALQKEEETWNQQWIQHQVICMQESWLEQKFKEKRWNYSLCAEKQGCNLHYMFINTSKSAKKKGLGSVYIWIAVT